MLSSLLLPLPSLVVHSRRPIGSFPVISYTRCTPLTLYPSTHSQPSCTPFSYGRPTGHSRWREVAVSPTMINSFTYSGRSSRAMERTCVAVIPLSTHPTTQQRPTPDRTVLPSAYLEAPYTSRTTCRGIGERRQHPQLAIQLVRSSFSQACQPFVHCAIGLELAKNSPQETVLSLTSRAAWVFHPQSFPLAQELHPMKTPKFSRCPVARPCCWPPVSEFYRSLNRGYVCPSSLPQADWTLFLRSSSLCCPSWRTRPS